MAKASEAKREARRRLMNECQRAYDNGMTTREIAANVWEMIRPDC